MLGGIQLGLPVEVPLCEIDGRVLICSLGCWWMLFCELDGARGHPAWAAGGGAAWGAGGCCASLTVLGGIQLGLLVEVPLCEIDGRVLACSLGCWWMLFCELHGARGHPAWAAGGGAALRD